MRNCVDSGRFAIAELAQDRMSARDLVTCDIETAILCGELVGSVGAEGRGARYIVEGPSTTGQKVRILCRFTGASFKRGDLVILALDGEGSAHSRHFVPW